MRLTFVTPRHLEKEKAQALKDADEYLARLREQDMEGEQPDDPRYLKSILQRFMTLYGIDPNESPERIVELVRHAALPEAVEKLLGHVATPKSPDFANMQTLVEKYLSTKDLYWTIVDKCELSGPFSNWHAQLQLVDLPGTNDTDPHRTSITNRLREGARAVAICTSDSNLGPDIESWLQNSSVLSEFLEATENRCQRLFILRTKFDSFHPELAEECVEDDESEERMYQEALKRHKREQTDAFHDMLREIATPRMPFGESELASRKREEMIARLNAIPVFFVSALAHEVFEDRYTVTRKTRRHFSEQFGDDSVQSGIPAVREYLNQMAEEHLVKNYYEDLECRLDKEVDLLVRFFRRRGKLLGAMLSGEGQSYNGLIAHVENPVIPWVRQQVMVQVDTLRRDALVAVKEIENRLDQVSRMSRRRMQDKAEKWMHIAWNSLKATARKHGVHTTCRGVHVDINQDICSVLVDDLILAWSSYRDYLIRERVVAATSEMTSGLVDRLQGAISALGGADAADVVKETVDSLAAMSQAQRDELVRQVDTKVKQLESIRQPAYKLIRDTMASTYTSISAQCGTGCQRRMHELLMHGMEQNIDRLRVQIQEMVAQATRELLDYCCHSLADFGTSSDKRIADTLDELRKSSRATEIQKAKRQLGVVQEVIAALPGPSA
jgi:hypothetical protein